MLLTSQDSGESTDEEEAEEKAAAKADSISDGDASSNASARVTDPNGGSDWQTLADSGSATLLRVAAVPAYTTTICGTDGDADSWNTDSRSMHLIES